MSSLSLDNNSELAGFDASLNRIFVWNSFIRKILRNVKRILERMRNRRLFASNDKIVFSSEIFGNLEIWSFESDGSRQSQLTNNSSDEEFKPIVSRR